MVAYNFKKQFAPLIETGQKNQTIRAHRKNRHAIKGERIQLYTGMRTKACTKLIDPDPLCVGSYWISIDGIEVQIDNVFLDDTERHWLAISDGFTNYEELATFFEPRMPFEGVLIAWNEWRPYWTPF